MAVVQDSDVRGHTDVVSRRWKVHGPTVHGGRWMGDPDPNNPPPPPLPDPGQDIQSRRGGGACWGLDDRF